MFHYVEDFVFFRADLVFPGLNLVEHDRVLLVGFHRHQLVLEPRKFGTHQFHLAFGGAAALGQFLAARNPVLMVLTQALQFTLESLDAVGYFDDLLVEGGDLLVEIL